MDKGLAYRTTTSALLWITVVAASLTAHAEESAIVLRRKELAERARQEATTPIHPGAPGQQPFWNIHSRKFMYAPAFDFAPVEGATSYRFAARSGTDFQVYAFTADTPSSDLSPIWLKLPVGMVELTVNAMDGKKVIKQAGVRRFYKDSPFKGPYRAPVVSYRQSAATLLEYTFNQPYIQHWRDTGEPDPYFGHYSYPSKIIGAVIEAMTLAIREDLPFKDDAREIAREASTFLIRTSLPADSPLAHFPRTYDRTHVKTPLGPAKAYKNQLMMFYPAEVGLQYLDLYRLTKDPALLEAAEHIADTYARTQLPSGTWPIKADVNTGKPVGDQLCIPVHIVRFLHEMVVTHGQKQFEQSCQAAFDWTMNNPVRTFDWTGQFEDVKQNHPPYANLSARAAALYFVIYLTENYRDDPAKMHVARELLRFAEDQFIVWERPAPALQPDLFDEKPGHHVLEDRTIRDTSTWITPGVLEQYGYYVPIGTSGSVALEAYLASWKKGGNDLDLAKAISLANNMTYLQLLHGDGGIPTHWAYTHRTCLGWINNLASQARALLAAADALEGKNIRVTEVTERHCAHTAAGVPCPYPTDSWICPYRGAP